MLVKQAIFFSALLFLCGCVQLEETSGIEIVEGFFYTPTDKIKIKQKQRRFEKVYFGYYAHAGYLAEGENTSIVVTPWSSYEFFNIVTWSDNKLFRYKQDGFITITGEENKPAILIDSQSHFTSLGASIEKYIQGRRARTDIKESRSIRLKLYTINEDKHQHYWPKFDQTLRVYFPFQINNSSYLVDVTYKFKKKYKLALSGLTYTGNP